MTSCYIYDARLKGGDFQNFLLTDLHPRNQIQFKNSLFKLNEKYRQIYSVDDHITNINIYDISDDSWINIFCYCNVNDLISIHQICNHFYKLTNRKRNKTINDFWKYQCDMVCNDIKSLKFTTPDWYKFFVALMKFYAEYFRVKPTTIIQALKININGDTINGDTIDTAKAKTVKTRVNKIANLFPMTIGKITINSILNNWHRESTIEMACRQDNILIFKLLINYLDYDINANIDEEFEHTCPTERGGGKMTILNLVARCGAVDIATFLLGNDDNKNSWLSKIDINNGSGYQLDTPLLLASYWKHIQIVKLLLKHPKMTKIGVNTCDTSGRTPLHCAVEQEFISPAKMRQTLPLVELLLKDGRVMLDKRNICGKTALDKAISAGLYDVVDVLRPIANGHNCNYSPNLNHDSLNQLC